MYEFLFNRVKLSIRHALEVPLAITTNQFASATVKVFSLPNKVFAHLLCRKLLVKRSANNVADVFVVFVQKDLVKSAKWLEAINFSLVLAHRKLNS